MLRPNSDDPNGGIDNILGDDPEGDDPSEIPEQLPEGDLGDPLSLSASEEGGDYGGLPPGEEPEDQDGINVNLGDLSDEQLVEFTTEHPGAVRHQAMFQAHHTQRSQTLGDMERTLAMREEQIALREATVNRLLEQQGGAPGQPPSPQRGVPSLPPSQFPHNPPQPQNPQNPAGLPVGPEQAQSVPELVSAIRRDTAAQIGQAVAQPLQEMQQMMQEMRHGQLQTTINTGFATLAESFPEVTKPEIRVQIEQVMVAEGITNPRLAYLHLLGPTIEARQRQALAAAKEKRQSQPSPKGGKGSRKPASTRAEAAKMTMAEKREAAERLAAQNPGAFEEDER